MNQTDVFNDEGYVQRYADSVIKRLAATDAMAIDIEVELKHSNKKDIHTILDIGCGVGDLTYVLKKRFGTAVVHALDISPLMLRKAKEFLTEKHINNVIYVNSAIESFEIVNNYFDLIVSQYTFSYWNHALVLSKLQKMLKPDGVIFLRNLNAGIQELFLDRFIDCTVVDEYEKVDFKAAVLNSISIPECIKLLEMENVEPYDIYFMHRNSKYNIKPYQKRMYTKLINYNLVIKKTMEKTK